MRSPDNAAKEVDAHVGWRVRLRRKQLGVSQQRLAEGLGLTFQQIQKYERGTNRISASTLFEISKLLAAPVSYFFAGLGAATPAGQDRPALSCNSLDQLLAEPDGLKFAEAFLNIHRRSVKEQVVNLIHAIAANDSTPTASVAPTPE